MQRSKSGTPWGWVLQYLAAALIAFGLASSQGQEYAQHIPIVQNFSVGFLFTLGMVSLIVASGLVLLPDIIRWLGKTLQEGRNIAEKGDE